jgi:hypothetical protein
MLLLWTAIGVVGGCICLIVALLLNARPMTRDELREVIRLLQGKIEG